MDVSNIIALARTLTHTNDQQVGDTQALEYLNIIYNKIANRIITQIDEDYFWDEFLTTPVIDQNEYTFQWASATTSGMKKITRVEMKWSDWDSYSKLVSADTLSSYSRTTDYLTENISTDEWFFDVKDWSLFIYPAPTEAVSNWLKVQAVITLPDLLTTDVEAAIFPRSSELREYHYALAIWMKQFIYANLWRINEKNDAITEFENELQRIINTVKDRTFAPVVTELPPANTFLSR